VAGSDQSPEELHCLWEDWGRYPSRAARALRSFERALPAALERLGFDARLDGDELALSACPCRLVSPGQPELVCNLAIAVVEGVLGGWAPACA